MSEILDVATTAHGQQEAALETWRMGTMYLLRAANSRWWDG